MKRRSLIILFALLFVLLVTISPNAIRGESIGDTLHFSIGNTQITAVIQSINGDTVDLNGEVINNNVGSLNFTGLKISYSDYMNGHISVVGIGTVDFSGATPFSIGNVTVTNLTGVIDSTGFHGNGAMNIAGSIVSIGLEIGGNGYIYGVLQTDSITIGGVTINNLTGTLSNIGFQGQGEFIYGSNTIDVLFETDYSGNINGIVDSCNISVGNFSIIDFHGTFTNSTFNGFGKIAIGDSYIDANLSLNNNSEITITDGYVDVGNVQIRNIRGNITPSEGFSGSGSIYFNNTILSVAFSTDLTSGDVNVAVQDPDIIVGGVRITNLYITFDTQHGFSGQGTVHIENLSYPATGMVTVQIWTDASGNFDVGIVNGQVTLNNGNTINNLNATVTNNGFSGSGTYYDYSSGSDVTVVFSSDYNGNISWSISGDAINIGDIVIHHYFVDANGGHGWWIVSPTDSIYLDVDMGGNSATVAYPSTFDLGGVTVSNFTGTLTYNNGVTSFSGQGDITIDGVTVTLTFGLNPSGKLVGTAPNSFGLAGGSITIYGVTLTLTEDGISGIGHLNLENVQMDVNFFVNFDGTVSGGFSNGTIYLGNLTLTNAHLQFSPLAGGADVVIPGLGNGTIGAEFQTDGNGGLAIVFNVSNIEVEGFTINGSVLYNNGNLNISGTLILPNNGGSCGVNDLIVNSTGIVSGDVVLSNVNIAGYAIVSGNGQFESNPPRLNINATVDLSSTGVLDSVIVQNLAINSDGHILSMSGLGVTGLNIGGFEVSGWMEITDNYIILHTLSCDLSPLGGGTVAVNELTFDRDGNFINVGSFGVTNLTVGSFKGSGWAEFIPDQQAIKISGMVSVTPIGYFEVQSLVLGYDGSIISLTGTSARITIGGYGFAGEVEMPTSDELYIAGSIQLPQFINNAAASGSITLKKTNSSGVMNTGFDVVGGSFDVPSFEIGGYDFTGASFAFDSVGVAGSADINIPNIAGIDVSFGFEWDGTFDSCSVVANGMSIPLGSTGLLLDGAGGGLYHYTSPSEYWEVMLTGDVVDATHTFDINGALTVTTAGQISGVGHILVANYTYGSASFDIDIPADTIGASAWLGEDPDEGIEAWGLYIKGQQNVHFNWVQTIFNGNGDLEIEVWFVQLGAQSGFAYNEDYPYNYGPYYMEKLWNDGLGAAGDVFGKLYGFTVVWTGSDFDFDTWTSSESYQPGNAPYVKELLFCGPYPHVNLNYDYLGGESNVMPYDSYNSVGGKTWHSERADNTGVFDLLALTGASSNQVEYGYTYIYNSADTVINAQMLSAATGAYKIILNDNQVGYYPTQTYLQNDRDTTILPLHHGWNRLMLKFLNSYGSDWQFCMRIGDGSGNEIANLTTQSDNPEASVVYHDKYDSYNYNNWNMTGNLALDNRTLKMTANGTSDNTKIEYKTEYNRITSPVMKTDFYLTGTDHSDSTFICAEGYDSTGTRRIFGVVYCYPGSKGETGNDKVYLVNPETGKIATSRGERSSIDLNTWYTEELVFEPELIKCYVYKRGTTRPITPLFISHSTDWNPRLFAAAGGADNITYLDNTVMKEVYKTDNTQIAETPHPYPNNYTNSWIMKSPGASAIRLHFSDISLESGYDSIYVYDKNGSLWEALTGNIGEYTSTMIPGDYVILKIKTDQSNDSSQYGFKVDYIQYTDEKPVWNPINEAISTPHQYANNYSNTWTINVPGANAVRVRFTNFSLGYGDVVNIYDAYDNLYATYTGELGDFTSVEIPGNSMKIEFISDDVNQGYGFDIKHAEYLTPDWQGVKEIRKPSKETPSITKISSVSPNPMKDASIIKFALSKSGNVKIDVYNSAGRRVVALINGTMGAGYHTVRWQRKDGSGRILPRGTYFIRLKTESITDVKKIVILN